MSTETEQERTGLRVGRHAYGEHPHYGRIAGAIVDVSPDATLITVQPDGTTDEPDRVTMYPEQIDYTARGDEVDEPAEPAVERAEPELTDGQVFASTEQYVQIMRDGAWQTLGRYVGQPSAAETCAHALRSALPAPAEVRIATSAPQPDVDGSVYRTPAGEVHTSHEPDSRGVVAYDDRGELLLRVVTGTTTHDREVHGAAVSRALSLIEWSHT